MNILNKLYVTCFRKERPKIMSNVLEAIGHTPLVQLNNIPREEGVNCRVCKLYLSRCIKGETFNGSTLMLRVAGQLQLVKTRQLVIFTLLNCRIWLICICFAFSFLFSELKYHTLPVSEELVFTTGTYDSLLNQKHCSFLLFDIATVCLMMV